MFEETMLKNNKVNVFYLFSFLVGLETFGTTLVGSEVSCKRVHRKALPSRRKCNVWLEASETAFVVVLGDICQKKIRRSVMKMCRSNTMLFRAHWRKLEGTLQSTMIMH